jgi:hypothetical protein
MLLHMPVILATQEAEVEEPWSEAGPAKVRHPI